MTWTALSGRRPEAPGPVLPALPEAAFQAPEYLEPSAWTEHVPFAFWLIDALRPGVLAELGVHYGTSYFAFCQEIRRQGLSARAWGVDSWKGDAHAGFYGEEVWEMVSRHNARSYPAFSTLVRDSFDAAARSFADGAIDLLHIDGLHEFEAVSADFATWLPKLSRRAVVLLHDTQVRDRGFGVFRLVETLRRRYPLFEFAHGHGLAVVGVGPEQSPALRALFAAEPDPGRKREVEGTFARLGRACLLEMEQRHRAAAAAEAAEDPRLVLAQRAIRGLTAGQPAAAVVEAIASSELFDAGWYAAQVPGLEGAGLDPARHYALFGPVLGLDPSPRFDAAWYLAAHPDVAAAGVNPLGHYLLHGRAEGRPTRARSTRPSPPPAAGYSRVAGVFGDYPLAGRRGLEIGALSRPFLKGVAGVTVFNLDHLPTAALKAKYAGNPRIRQQDIVPVDFVLDGTRPIHEVVAAAAPFDFAVGIHVAEHVPDLLGWLDDLAAALTPDGVIALALPDKRRCFDLARPLSTVEALVGAQLEERRRPPPAVVFEAYANTYMHKASPVWVPVLKPSELRRAGSLESGLAQARLARETYVDAHCWVFTARAFVRILAALHRLDLLRFRVRHFEVPPPEFAEFHVLLEKCADQAAVATSLHAAWEIADRDPIPG
jgi:hypothetical protein